MNRETDRWLRLLAERVRVLERQVALLGADRKQACAKCGAVFIPINADGTLPTHFGEDKRRCDQGRAP
jgi:hypothetical protein